MNRRWLTGVGVLAIAIGFAVLAERTLAVGLDRAALVLVGAFAILQGIRYTERRRHVDRRTAKTDEPETRDHVPVPGDELDDTFDRGRRWQRRSYPQETARRELREIAVETLALRGPNDDRAAIRARIERGEWPDDPVAAAFLAGRPLPPDARLRCLLRRESAYEHGLERAVAAVAAAEE